MRHLHVFVVSEARATIFFVYQLTQIERMGHARHPMNVPEPATSRGTLREDLVADARDRLQFLSRKRSWVQLS